MNSLPFISHHLFVAAIGNEGRVPDRSTRRDRPPEGPTERAAVIALGVEDARKLMPQITTLAPRARITQAQA
jgi:hypothetical protein